MPPADRGAQLALPFCSALSYAAADFVPGAANAEARAWLDRWPNWPGRRLALIGPPGSGKSHLAAVWRERTGALALTGAAVAAASARSLFDLADPSGAILVEDADAVPQGRALVHLLNAASEAGGTVLMTARTPPSRWRTGLADLRSRLAATATATIASPDEALIEAVLAKLMADRQLVVPPRLLAALAVRLPRDFAAVQALAEALDAASLAAGRRVTRELAAAALAHALAVTGHAPGADPAAADDTPLPPGPDPSPGKPHLR
ncbi:chromosomal replication initiator DnaA [Elioraea tepida]|uniref:Chromosomal replication initiator DnaA n=1 Tax=Elioraea tepida TaxID=2843330 RepID=A0A975U151_9PROT|nr:DnaA/Hda family protein [Elioraea tepida]QXM23448.1 chromosomal replication initiator DnaA [Elioraea tepida]